MAARTISLIERVLRPIVCLLLAVGIGVTLPG